MFAGRFTLLILQQKFLARADFARRGGRPLGPPERLDADPNRSLGERIGELVRKTGKLQTPTFVLTDEVFLQTLELDARLLRGLSPAELQSALTYEAQVHSGLPSAEAETRWRGEANAEGTSRGFLVAQVGHAELAEVVSAVRAGGGRLAGLGHPAGLPRSLTRPRGEAFTRIENWTPSWVTVEGEADGSVAVRVERSSPRSRYCALPPEESVTERLSVSTSFPGGLEEATFDLDAPEALAIWLGAWAKVLLEKEAALLFVPAKRDLSRAGRIAASAGLAGGLLTVCGFDAVNLRSTSSELEARRLSEREPIERANRARTQLNQLEREWQELVETPRPVHAASRTSWSPGLPAHFLRALAEARPEGLRIERFRVGWQGISLEGLATGSAAIDRFGRALDERLSEWRYSVVPLARRLVTRGPAAGLYEFELGFRSEQGALRLPEEDE